MKTIELTAKNDAIFVGDVVLSDGVYSKSPRNTWYVCRCKDELYRIINIDNPLDMGFSSGKTLAELMEKCPMQKFFTLDNRRIVLEKALRIEGLSPLSHIGFITASNEKGFVIIQNTESVGLWQYNGWQLGSYFGKTLKDAIDNCTAVDDYKPSVVYQFDTRRELYAWLAE